MSGFLRSAAKWLLYLVAGAGLFYGGALLSVRLSDSPPNVSTDPSTQVPPDRTSGPPPGYEPPAPGDTPCLQPEYVSLCIGRSRARTGMMRLAGLQEAHERVTGRYVADARVLGFETEDGMELRMRGDEAGWTAQYRHVAGEVGCAIYVGEVAEPFTTVRGGVPDSPDAVACDDPLAAGR